MIFVAIIGAAILGLAIHFLGPKSFWDKSIPEILVSRTSISLLISASILGLSCLYLTHIRDPLSDSGFQSLIDTILGIPMALPFILGFSEGETYAIAAIAAEIALMTGILRLFISKGWTERLRGRLKKRNHNGSSGG